MIRTDPLSRARDLVFGMVVDLSGPEERATSYMP